MTRPTPGAVTSTTSYGADGWWERAACRNADPDAFTPPGDEYRAMTPAESAYARTYCARCPVAPECLKDALDKGDDYGIRGGVDMATRNGRRRGKTAAATVPTQATTTATVKPAKKRNPTQEARRAADRARAHQRRAEGNEPPCGTRAGYDHHRAIGEPYCGPCRNYRATESQTERDRNRRPTQADTLIPEVLHLVALGADIHRAARATSKTIGALEKALQRAQRHDPHRETEARSLTARRPGGRTTLGAPRATAHDQPNELRRVTARQRRGGEPQGYGAR